VKTRHLEFIDSKHFWVNLKSLRFARGFRES
jgi:hypothetical protein